MTSKIIHSDSDPFLTTKEAARALGVTLRTVQLWVNDGKLQAARTPGGHRRIRTSDVRALQETMGIKPAKVAVMLTDEGVARIYEAWREGKSHADLIRATECAVLAANGLWVDHA